VETQRQKLQTAEATLQRITQLVNRGAVSSEELAKAKATYDEAKLALKQAELALQGMIGRLAAGEGGGAMGGMGGMQMGGIVGGRAGMVGVAGVGLPGAAGGGGLGVFGGGLGAMGGGGMGIAEPVRLPRGPVADKIKRALDAQIKLDGLTNVTLHGVI